VVTLSPGDLVLTGTPEGVGRLAPGDVVEVVIDAIGTLENRVADRGRGDAPVSPALRLRDGAALLDTGTPAAPGTIGVYLVPQRGDAGPRRPLRPGRGRRRGRPADGGGAPSPTSGSSPAASSACWSRTSTSTTPAPPAPGRRGTARGGGAGAGAEHLLDPSRLLASARRVYGDALERTWGGMTPLPAAALEAVEDGDELDVGGRRVRVVATPGHARHHAAFVWPDGVVYTGDAAGVRFAPGPWCAPRCRRPRSTWRPGTRASSAWPRSSPRAAAHALRRVRRRRAAPGRGARAHPRVGRRAAGLGASRGATRAEARRLPATTSRAPSSRPPAPTPRPCGATSRPATPP
jgi:glyoxylase-like metal-dependent hydrolase (beta-lactamase superfamily II)